MGQILSQEEVDALLRGMVGGEMGAIDSGRIPNIDIQIAKPYDFAAHDRLTRGKLPVLDALNDRFCRLFRLRLSNMLRKIVDMNYASLETLKFGNLMRSISVPSSINIIRSEKFGLNALIILESKLVITLIDLFFGGRGSIGGYKIHGREFTSIELNMLNKVAEGALKDINESFKPVDEMGFKFSRSESNPQFAGILNENDQVVVAEFDIGLENIHGSVILCLPYALIEMIKSSFNNKHYLHMSPEPGSEWSMRVKHNLKTVPVELALELGNAKLTGRQISRLRKGDVIMLNCSAGDELKIKVQGQTKFYGIAGKTGEKMAVEITRASERQD